MDLAKSKIGENAFYLPGASSIEGMPMKLQFFHDHPRAMLLPHWHAQLEVNYIMRGHVHYRMGSHELTLSAGQMCLFWGGQPHRMDESSRDSIYAGAHMPLVHFFRMRLPAAVSGMLMGGATMLTDQTDAADRENFPRWFRYVTSGDEIKAQHAVEELLLRVERMFMEPYATVSTDKVSVTAADTSAPSPAVVKMCRFIAANFLDDIDAADIA